MDEKLFPRDKFLAKTQPRAADYAMLHGKWSLMSRDWNGAKLGPYKSTEAVYDACLKKGVTWQELLNYNPEDDNKIY